MDDIEVQLGPPRALEERTADGTVIRRAGNVIEVDFDEQTPSAEPIDTAEHYQNLATVLDEQTIGTLGQELIEAVEQDIESRKDWNQRMARGIRLMGLAEDPDHTPFPGASQVVHPMLAEASVQFQARAIAELFPPAGPVKGMVMGEADPDIDARRERGEDYMNYQYTQEMPEAFWEMDKLLYRLPLEGSAFKKVWVDRLKDRISQKFVAAEDVIVPYTSSELESAPRYTHRIRYYPNDMRKLQRSGFYRMCELAEPVDDEREGDDVKDEIDKTEGRSGSDMRADRQYEVYEIYVDHDFAGTDLADKDPVTDAETGIGLPYVISVEKESQVVLAIRRNWKPDDPKRAKRSYFVHYKFLPGLGFYGHGFIHTIGGLGDAATGALRALLDAAQLSNMQGGFKSKDARVKDEGPLKAGEWRDTDMTAEELSKAFFPLKYPEPSMALFQLLGALVETGQRFASTTEAMVGDADNKGPVGTTIALIEQGSKVFSAIHKRLHRAQGEEFGIVADLNFEILPVGQEYPYQIAGAERHVIRDDFDGRVDWVPVSDPNIFSATQRIAQAQGVLQLSTSAPNLYNQREAHKRMLEAMKVDDYDGNLLIDPEKRERMDPMTENMALLHGKPIRAFPEQDHKAHMMVLMSWFEGLPKEGQKMLQAPVFAHYAEHMAFQYRNDMQQAMGIPLPFTPNFHAEPGEDMVPEMPPHIENMLAGLTAQASMKMKQEKGMGGDKPDPETEAAMAEVRRKDMAAAADAKRKDQIAQSDIARKDMVTMADQRREEQEFRTEQAMEIKKFVAEQERKDREAQARARAVQRDHFYRPVRQENGNGRHAGTPAGR